MSTRQGVALSLLSSLLFGLMYYVSTLLTPLSGTEVYGWRMLMTWPVMTAFLLMGERWSGMGRAWLLVRTTLARLRREPVLWAVLPLSSALLGCNSGSSSGRRRRATDWTWPWATSCCP